MVVFQIFVPQKVCYCQVGLQCLFSDPFPRVYVFHRAACNAKVRTRHALFLFLFLLAKGIVEPLHNKRTTLGKEESGNKSQFVNCPPVADVERWPLVVVRLYF